MSKKRKRQTPADVIRVQELRRSSAASPVRRDPTRADARRQAIRESRDV